MGKIYKRKLRSCGLCKPHKRGWQPRYKSKELKYRQSTDNEMKEAKEIKKKQFID